MAFELLGLAVLLVVAFGPSLIYMARVRNLERVGRNPWMRMMLAFGWGAIAAIIIAVILELALPSRLDSFRPARVPSELFLAVVIAPLAEETAKVLGVFPLSASKRWEEEDGLVYGAAVGLGFAATENLFYEVGALIEAGFAAWVLTAIIRSLTSTLLHASASAMAGWGVSKIRVDGAPGVVKFFALLLVAMVMHGVFNLAASLGQMQFGAGSLFVGLMSIVIVFVFAGYVYRFTRRKIQELDRKVHYARVV